MSKKTWLIVIGSAYENSACRGTIEPYEAKWQANELVDSGPRYAQVEPLYNHDFFLEQSDVSSVMTGVKLLDREIVDANELDASIDEILRAIRREICVVNCELRTADKRRVPSSKKDAFV